MKWVFAFAVFTALLIVWVTFIRPWMRDKPWAKGFFEAIEPIELHLWRKSETLLFARFKIVTGLLLTLLTQLGAIDITPLMPFVPDAWEGVVRIAWNALPLVITLVGWADEALRKDTTKPLEAVAVPENNKPPEVAQAEVRLQAAVNNMKETFDEAKAEGKL